MVALVVAAEGMSFVASQLRTIPAWSGTWQLGEKHTDDEAFVVGRGRYDAEKHSSHKDGEQAAELMLDGASPVVSLVILVVDVPSELPMEPPVFGAA